MKITLGTSVSCRRGFLPDGVLRRDDPLRGGEMGELGLAGDVADGEDRRRLGAAIVVGVDEAARVGLEPGGGEVRGRRSPACGRRR